MSSAVVAAWEASGRRFAAGGTTSFVAERGAGEPVLCLHGVPASAFLYRKVLDELAARGLRGIAFDLPGLGLADRPADFDYTWTGLGRFCVAAVDALELDRFHLVVHDIGGPAGFELAAAAPDRIASLTILNTIIEVDTFHRPWVMEPFARRGIGDLWLRSMRPVMFRALMGLIGVGNRSAVPDAELDAYVELLKREDGGRAFLRIMRGFERTREKRLRYVAAVTDGRYPVHALWGADDPALPVDPYGEIARDLTGAERLDTVAAKHFLQEDQATAIADRVARIVAQA